MADLVVIGYPDEATVEINAALEADRVSADTLAGASR